MWLNRMGLGHGSRIMGHGSVFVWFNGSWVTACDPLPALLLNFWALNAISSKRTDFKFDKHVSRNSPDMSP